MIIYYSMQTSLWYCWDEIVKIIVENVFKKWYSPFCGLYLWTLDSTHDILFIKSLLEFKQNWRLWAGADCSQVEHQNTQV